MAPLALNRGHNPLSLGELLDTIIVQTRFLKECGFTWRQAIALPQARKDQLQALYAVWIKTPANYDYPAR